MDLQQAVKVAVAIKRSSQVELAKHLGMSEGGLSVSLKTSSTKFSVIIAIANFFNMKVSEFIALGESK